MNRLAVALATIVSLCPLTALGQDSDNERARVHFSSGRSYFDEGNYERALEEFQQAYALSPLPLMLFNIGTTQERLGMLREAADTFERFLREVPDADNRDVLTRRIANLRSRADRVAAGHADPGEQAEATTTATPVPRG
ncbi:MAG: tetratricopeptide repeat protein, partial [Sandaracinaceae bacterium]|nr:tetratricopeptide repeat protein [Sandaracinaceae bacterium]